MLQPLKCASLDCSHDVVTRGKTSWPLYPAHNIDLTFYISPLIHRQNVHIKRASNNIRWTLIRLKQAQAEREARKDALLAVYISRSPAAWVL